MTAQRAAKEFERGSRPPLRGREALPGEQFRLDPLPIDDIMAGQ
jgi:hypothetical protein